MTPMWCRDQTQTPVTKNSLGVFQVPRGETVRQYCANCDLGGLEPIADVSSAPIMNYSEVGGWNGAGCGLAALD